MAIIKLMGSSLHSQIGRQPQSTKLLPYASLISGFSPPATNIIPSRSPTVDTLPTMTTPRYLNFHVARVTHNIPIVPKSIIFAKCQPRWVAAMDEKSCCPKCESGPHGTGTSPDMNAIGCIWVYKAKLKQDGSLERIKAQLVAKRFSQVDSIDFLETFPLVLEVVKGRDIQH